MRFARVDGGGNVIEVAPHALPQFTKVGSIAHPVRQLWQNGDQAGVFALGWYPVNELAPGYDDTTHKFDGTYAYVKNGNQIDATANGTPMSAQEIADKLAAEIDNKVKALKAEGLTRIQAHLPGIKDFDELTTTAEIWKSLVQGAKNPTPAMDAAIQDYTKGVAAVTAIRALTTISSVRAYDVTTDPGWP